MLSESNNIKDKGIRVKLNVKSDKIGAKIRESELEKVNVMVIIGENEKVNGTVSVRKRFQGSVGEMSLEELIGSLSDEIKTRRISNSEEAKTAS